MSRPELTVIAPCLNEELNIPELAQRVIGTFDRGRLNGELVIVDDGSTDDTARVIKKLEAAHPGRVVGRFHGFNRGIAQGWKTGVSAARGDLVAVIDSDLQYQPEDLIRLHRELLEHSVDIVQGWRSPFGRHRGNRYHLSRGFNVLLNGTFGMRLRDNKSGYIMCAKEVLEDLLTYRGSYHYWQSFIMVAAHTKGYSYKEVETRFEDRKAGESFLDKVAYRASARSIVDLATAAIEYRVLHRGTDVADQFLRRHAVKNPSAPPSLSSRTAFSAYVAAQHRITRSKARSTDRAFALLGETQWLETNELSALQDEKLRRLVRHAFRNVPFYRARMRDAGLRPEDVRTQADLVRLPTLSLSELQDRLYFDILSENHDKEQVLKVEALTRQGEVVTSYVDRAQLEFRRASRLRSFEWAGYTFGDRWIRLVSDRTARRGDSPQSTVERVLAHRIDVDASVLDTGRAKTIAGEIARHAPTVIEGDAEVLDFLAGAIDASRGATTRSRTAIVARGQTLSAAMRERIERGFGARVFDSYGTSQLGLVAFECEARTGHHVVGEGHIVEVLVDGRAARPGEVGEIVVTDLNNYCLPLIRFRTGDFAIATDPQVACSCGRGLPLLGSIEGTRPAMVRGGGGRAVSTAFFGGIMKDFDYAFRAFTLKTLQGGGVELRLVKGGRCSPEVVAKVEALCRAALGGVPFEVKLLDDEDLAPSIRRPAMAQAGTEQ